MKKTVSDKRKHARVRRKLWTIIIIAAIIAIGFAIKGIPAVHNAINELGLAGGYIAAVGSVTEKIPFSLFELMIVIAILAALTLIILLILSVRSKRARRGTGKFVYGSAVTVGIVVILYLFTASFSYYRPNYDVAGYLGDIAAEEIDSMLEGFLADFNALAAKMEFSEEDGALICPYTEDELMNLLRAEADRFSADDYFYDYTPKPKGFYFSRAVSYYGLGGIFFAPTAEPNVNMNIPNVGIPCIALHELMHSKGVMNEGQANLLSAYLAFSSQNEYIRYTAYWYYFYTVLGVGSQIHPEGYGEYEYFYDAFTDRLAPQSRQQWEVYRKYIEDSESFFEDINDFFNNIYLKLMGLNEGTGSYTNYGGGDQNIIIIDPNKPDEPQIIKIYLSNLQKALVKCLQEKD